MTDYTYPTKEAQLPPYRLFTIDLIREVEPTINPEGEESYKYLGIRVFTHDQKVKNFYQNKQANFGELHVAQSWIEEQIKFLNAFWDVEDYTYIITPAVMELIGLATNAMIEAGVEVFRQKSMLN